MRNLLLLLLISASSVWARDGYSQGTQQIFSVKSGTIESIFKQIRGQSQYEFFYNTLILDVKELVTLSKAEGTLEEILKEVLKDKYTYKIQDHYVLISLQEEQVKSLRIKGFVRDEKKQPIPRATIRLVGTTMGTATDTKGWFAMELPVLKGKLEFSFVGFKKHVIDFTEKTAKDTLLITLVEETMALDEAVVVAYGTTTRRKSTGAISVVKADELKGIPASNIASLLQGRVAGMDITNLSGAPGGGDMAITIRGYNSLDVEQGRRFSNPLWVVDGVPLNSFTSPVTGTNLLSDLNPDMIESIQILKDASSAAIYGSRAANGVIIVTTKKGRKDQDATFSVNVSRTWSILPSFPTLTTGRAERLFRLRQMKNSRTAYLDESEKIYKYPTSLAEQYELRGNSTGTYDPFWSPSVHGKSPENASSLQDSLNPFYNQSTNFFPFYFETARVWNANIQTYGGSERMNYGVGLGYYDETGVFKGTGYKRVDLNSSMTVNPVNKLSVDLRFNASLSQKKRASSSQDGSLYSGEMVPLETIPGEPYRLSSLLPGEGSVVWDEILKKYEGTKEKNRSIRIRPHFRLAYNVIEGLDISSSLSVDYSIARRNYFSPAYLQEDKFAVSLGETSIYLMVLNENLISYQRTFKDDHTLDFVAGFSYQYDQEEYNGGKAKGSPSDKIHYAPVGLPTLGTESYGSSSKKVAMQSYVSDMQEKALVSYFARLEYDYRGKYLVSFSLRRDGSSTFGRDNRWGTFPSVAAGWSFSEENWVKDYLGWLSFGKIRASWGRSGMHFSQNYLALGIMQIADPKLGNSTIEPVWGDGLYNDELAWEETDQYDFGVDMDFFDHRLGITFDYYYRYTDKLLDKVKMPGNGAFSTYNVQWRNSGAISNEGIELMVKYDIFRKQDLYWKVSVNAARNWNRFEKSYTGKDDETEYRIIGKPLNQIYAIQTDGFVNSQDEVPIFFNQQGIRVPLCIKYGEKYFYKVGDRKLIDANGDRIISRDDAVNCGSALPIVSGGIVSELRWRNFDVNLSMSFQLGRHMISKLETRAIQEDCGIFEGYYSALVMDIDKLDFWEKPGDQADYPMFQRDENMKGNFWVYDLDSQVEKVNWLKLKTLSVGYTLPKKWMKKIGLNEFRIFASGENLLTWTNFSGIDPEIVDIRTGVEKSSTFPLARKLTLGVTVKF